MTFDDYLRKQDNILIEYWGEKSSKRVLSLDGVDLKDVYSIDYLKYDPEKGELVCHREDSGPAWIKFFESGNVRYNAWYQNHKPHRLDGPAFIEYDENGNVKEVEFWINGTPYKNLTLGGKL